MLVLGSGHRCKNVQCILPLCSLGGHIISTSFLLVEIISVPCVNSDYIKSDQNLWLPFINAFDF